MDTLQNNKVNNKKQKYQMRKAATVGFIILLLISCSLLYATGAITKDAMKEVQEAGNSSMSSETEALANECALFLTQIEDEIDKTMKNAALLLQSLAAGGQMDATSLKALTQQTSMSDMYIFGLDGITKLSTIKEAESLNLFLVWEGYRMLVTGESTELPSNIKVQAETGAIYKFTALPLYNTQGEIAGIVESALNAQALEASMQQILNKKEMLLGIYLFTPDGLTLLSNSKKESDIVAKRGTLVTDSKVLAEFPINQSRSVDAPNNRLHYYIPMERNGAAAYVLLLEFDKGYYQAHADLFATTVEQLRVRFFEIVVLVIILLALLVFLLVGTKISNMRTRQHEYKQITEQALRTIANTIDAKDNYTSGHSTRVAKYSKVLAEHLNLSEDQQEKIYYMALLHDIGKVGIPDAILNKEGKLTEEEFNIMRTHTSIGADILRDFTALPDIAWGAMYHHKRFDGCGYPDIVQQTDTPLVVQIIGVADAYDAMATKRSYKNPMSKEEIIEQFRQGSGSQFEVRIANLMIELIEANRFGDIECER